MLRKTGEKMELSPRLLKIASLVPNGAKLADIGTDHGYIPLYLFMEGVIDSALAMDVNPMPLKRAEDNITNAGYGHLCGFRLSNGLEKLKKHEADVIVIAGMGGLLIRDILHNGKHAIAKGTRLLLQPMIAPSELRQYLFQNGYTIENEYVVREENKFYNIISALPGNDSGTDEDIYIGRNVSVTSPDVYGDYLEYKLRVCTNIISGMEKSKNTNVYELEKYKSQSRLYKKHLNME